MDILLCYANFNTILKQSQNKKTSLISELISGVEKFFYKLGWRWRERLVSTSERNSKYLLSLNN